MTISTRDNYNLLTETGKIIIYATEAAIYSNIRQIMIQSHVLKLNKILHTIHYHHAFHYWILSRQCDRLEGIEGKGELLPSIPSECGACRCCVRITYHATAACQQ